LYRQLSTYQCAGGGIPSFRRLSSGLHNNIVTNDSQLKLWFFIVFFSSDDQK
jgi:hypothetical protein